MTSREQKVAEGAVDGSAGALPLETQGWVAEVGTHRKREKENVCVREREKERERERRGQAKRKGRELAILNSLRRLDPPA